VSGRRAIVVGGGVAGLCCAYYMRKRDFEVTVVESNRVGTGASWGNGGWLCPAQSGPLPEPGLTLGGLRMLFNAESALYFAPASAAQITPWLLQFLTYCNGPAYRHGLAAWAALGRKIFTLVEAMAADGVEFELYRQGMLCAAQEPDVAARELRKLAPMRDYGYELPDDILTGDELHALEPALSPAITAGFEIQQHWHVRPDSFTAGLAAALRRMGVEIVEAAEVVDFVATSIQNDARAIRRVRTTAGDLDAETFVLAAGARTQPLARMLGVSFPMQAGKGYSFFVRPSVMPRHAILLADVHVGCTPLGDVMRIGGTMEFSGLNTRLDRRRIDATIRGAKRSFAEWASPEVEHEWAGMRPITPDGLPVLDRAPGHDNVFIATGYSMQGMTVGPPAGEQLAEFVASGRRPEMLGPFRADRFRGLRGWDPRSRTNGHRVAGT
jgi:D-amino-acid dehydrogenase